jgi:hypothetical protein
MSTSHEAEFSRKKLHVFKICSDGNILLRIDNELFPGTHLTIYFKNIKKLNPQI